MSKIIAALVVGLFSFGVMAQGTPAAKKDEKKADAKPAADAKK